MYAQSDTLLLADVSKNFRNKWIQTYELDPAYFLSGLGLALQAFLKTGNRSKIIVISWYWYVIDKWKRN